MKPQAAQPMFAALCVVSMLVAATGCGASDPLDEQSDIAVDGDDGVVEEAKSEPAAEKAPEEPGAAFEGGDHVDEMGQVINGNSISPENSGAVMLQMLGKMCSGTLLTNDWVLTAAHCVDEGVAPSDISVTYGWQSRSADWHAIHPGWWGEGDEDAVDVALVHLSSPLSHRGSTSGHKMSIYAGSAYDLIGTVLTCKGYGAFSSDESGAGVLRRALLEVEEVDQVGYDLMENEAEQILYMGDSGSSCLLDVHGGRQITGVQSLSYELFEVGDAWQVSAQYFKDWVLGILHSWPKTLPMSWEKPLPNNAYRTSIYNPCNGGCFSWTANYDFEPNYDYGYIAGTSMTGWGGTKSGTACGEITVQATTDYSVLSNGFSSIKATCQSGLHCSGPNCFTTPASLPDNASFAMGADAGWAWNPCNGYCFTWKAHYNMEYNYDFAKVNGQNLTGTGEASGSACGSIPVSVTTDYSVASGGLRLEALCKAFDVAPAIGHETDGGGVAVGHINNNLDPELILMGYDDPEEANSFRMRIGWDMKNGAPQSWGYKDFPGFGWLGEGAGIALGNFDADSRPDLVVMAYDAPDGANDFRYAVYQNLDAAFNPTSLSGPYVIAGVGEVAEGAGVAVGNIDNDARPEIILMAYDAPSGANSFRMRIGWNANSGGSPASWTYMEVPGVGYFGEGAGVALANLDNNARPELILMAYDAPDRVNTFRRTIGWNIDLYGNAQSFTTHEQPGLGWAGAGADVAVFNQGGQPTLVEMVCDDAEGPNDFRYRFTPATLLD